MAGKAAETLDRLACRPLASFECSRRNSDTRKLQCAPDTGRSEAIAFGRNADQIATAFLGVVERGIRLGDDFLDAGRIALIRGKSGTERHAQNVVRSFA